MLATSDIDDHTATLRIGNVFNTTVYYGDVAWQWTTAENTTELERAATDASSTVWIAVLSVMAGVTSLVTVGGNLIVIVSFALEHSIRQPSNYFIASLAVSDFLIGTVSMPFYTSHRFKACTQLHVSQIFLCSPQQDALIRFTGLSPCLNAVVQCVHLHGQDVAVR